MRMTREEAIDLLRDTTIDIRSTREDDIHTLYATAQMMAIDALRPVSREQVEKVWRGECDCSNPKACCTCCSMRCQYCIGQSEYKQATFCMKCGRPLTNEALEMVMKRLEALHDNRT